MRLLIDECLSPALVALAHAAGHEAAHVVHLGLGGWSDSQITRKAVDEDWTLVTRNSDDFRPRRGSLSRTPRYLREPLHAGLICLNVPEGAGRETQRQFFTAALRHVGFPGTLVNQCLEVDPAPGAESQAVIVVYDFPASDV